MSKAIRKGKMYSSGSMIEHCKYLKDGFVFDHELKERPKPLIRNGKKVVIT